MWARVSFSSASRSRALTGVPERVEHVAGEVVGARASRDLRIVAQVLHDERQIVRLIRAGGAIDHRVEADGRVLGAFHHIRVGEDAPPRVENPVLRAGLVHGRGDVIAARAGRGRVERARVSARQSLRPVRPVVPVHDHDGLPSEKSVDVPSGRKLCVRPEGVRLHAVPVRPCDGPEDPFATDEAGRMNVPVCPARRAGTRPTGVGPRRNPPVVPRT